MKNILTHVPYREKKLFAGKLKQIWQQPDKKMALKVAEMIMEEYQEKYPAAVKCLKEGLEDTFSYYDYPEVDSRKISSSNRKIIQRDTKKSRVVGVSPSKDSYIRLITMILIEYSEDWEVE